MDEKHRLQDIASRINYSSGMNGVMIEYGARLARQWFRPGRVLELGPADGLSTSILSIDVEEYEVVEASAEYCAQLSTRVPHVRIHHCLFEDFSPANQYDTLVLSHVLEHVEDPGGILALATQWLTPGGHLIAATPNGQSLHRQLGVLADLMNDVTDLNDADRSIGHRRVFTPESLRALVAQELGLEEIHFGGYYMKSFSNSQIEAVTDSTIREALMKLGEMYPEIAGDIYIVARRKRQ